LIILHEYDTSASTEKLILGNRVIYMGKIVDISVDRAEGEPASKRSWSRRITIILTELLALFMILTLADLWLTRNYLHGEIPQISVQTLSGERFDSDELIGSSYIIHFWATWCPICELEQGVIDDLAGDVRLYSIAMQSGSDQEVKDYLEKLGYHYPVINDQTGLLTKTFGINSVPVSFVVDSKGVVRFVTRGYSSPWGLKFRLWLADIIG
jgi:thiol-disulfide isomerase/thioredoxin